MHGSMLLYVHRNHKAHWDGEPRTATSTFTQLLNSVTYTHTHTHTHTHTLTASDDVMGRDVKNSLEISITQVRLEGGF